LSELIKLGVFREVATVNYDVDWFGRTTCQIFAMGIRYDKKASLDWGVHAEIVVDMQMERRVILLKCHWKMWDSNPLAL